MKLNRPARSHLFFYLVLLLFSFEAIACAVAEEVKNEKLNQGYYLLYQLSDDESQLPYLFIMKSAPKQITGYAYRISKVANETKALIEEFHAKNPNIRFDVNPLPAAEKEVRKSISNEKEHQLLFGTSGAEFQKAILVSQIEASGYGSNLAKVLSQDESDRDHSKKLMEISQKWAALQQEAYRLL